PNGRRETIARRVVGGIPGTVAGSIAEEGGTAHVTSFEYRDDGESPASPTKITQSEGGNTGVTRDSLAPSRVHLKTGTSDVNEGATVGQESVYGTAGRVVANRTLSGVPDLGSNGPSSGVVRESKYTYKDASSENKHERGAVDTISIAGTRAVTHAVDGFDLAGEKVVTKDVRRDVTTTVETDANDRVVHSAIADGTLGDEHFGYDASGRLAYSSRKQSGATIETTIEYDAVGRAIATTQTGANVEGTDASLVTTTTYDLANRTIEQSDPHVGNATFAKTIAKLDGLGRTTESTRTAGAESITARFGYDKNGSPSFETDRIRRAAARRFDSRGRELESVDSIGVKQTSAWSAWDELLDSTTLDAHGVRVAASHRSYTPLGNLRSSAEELVPGGASRITAFAWNSGATIVGSRVGLAPSLNGQLLGLARGSEQTLDAEGRVLSARSGAVNDFNGSFVPSEIFTRTTYAGFQGNLPSTVTTSDRGGSEITSRFSYDALGRQTSVVAGDTYTTTTSYDEAGNTTRVTPPGMQPRAMRYDARGLLLEETLQDGHQVKYSYDALGNLLERTDESGEKTRYEVDALGRVTTVTYADATTEITHYEPVTGAVQATKNRANQWRSFVFDARGAVTEVHNAQTPDGVHTLIEWRTYDAAGRLEKVTNRDGSIAYDDFDLLGRPGTTRTYRYKNASGFTTGEVFDVHTQAHEWNEHGERTRWRMPVAGGSVPSPDVPTLWRASIFEDHDAAGNVTELRGARTAGTSTIVTAFGRAPGRLGLRSRTTASGDPLQSTYRYADASTPLPDFLHSLTPQPRTANGMLWGIETSRGSAVVSSMAVGRDATSRIGAIVDGAFGSRTSAFRYDNRGRLEISSLAIAPGASAGPTIDAMTAADFRGSRTTSPRLTGSQHALLGNALAASLEVATWAATELPGHRLDLRTASLDGTPVATTQYEFTGGRRTKQGDATVTYDELDRLTSLTNETLGRRISYVYDPNGRVIGRTALKASSTEWVLEDRPSVLAADALPPDVTFVWDSMSDRLVSMFVAGASTQTGATPDAGRLRQYVHGDQAYDDPVEVLTSDQVNIRRYLPLVDEAGTGNVTAVLDDQGALVERVLYGDAYGDAPRYLQ
ncbi:MAG TPA: hypothetical protein VN605_14225, partial [Thermoanaerobaculia bacterium]|nr:hypothetical protein [Thermoanaerobaculia bacterium]